MSNEQERTGFNRMFNSYTMFGRRNVAAATLSLIAVTMIFRKITKK